MAQASDPKEINNANKKLVDLMFAGLDHGIESIRVSGKGPLIPFLMVETNGQKRLKRYVGEKLEDGLNEGLNDLHSDKECEFAIIAYDGYLTIDGQKYDCIIVKGFDRSDNIGYQIGRRYIPKTFLKSFKLKGHPTYIGTVQQLLK